MRFLALVQKELRECLPWTLLAAVVFLAVGGFFLRWEGVYGRYARPRADLPSESNVKWDWGARYSSLQMVGPVLFLTAIGLGLVMAVRQFWIHYFTGTWPFLIHRSVSRETIFWAKFTAATLGFIISTGAVWYGLYWYACQPELFIAPPTVRVFIEGWIFILLGLVVYLGTALVGLSTARWYTTKIFALAFAAFIILMVFVQCRLAWAFAVIIVGVVILLSQIIETISKREF